MAINYRKINDFLNWLFARLENLLCRRVRVGDWYLTNWDHAMRDYHGVYEVEEINGDCITTRYRGTSDNYKSNLAQEVHISVLRECFTHIEREKILNKKRENL